MAASRDAQDDASYQVVARRFRPQTFQELVGQDEVLTSLRAALQQGRVPHAFLFSGSRGVGKTTRRASSPAASTARRGRRRSRAARARSACRSSTAATPT
jgi:replication-associated recombination protein RarA